MTRVNRAADAALQRLVADARLGGRLRKRFEAAHAAQKKKERLSPAQRERPVFGVRLPRPMADRLRERAIETGVPMGELLERFIEKAEKEDAEILRKNPGMPARERLSHNVYSPRIVRARRDRKSR